MADKKLSPLFRSPFKYRSGIQIVVWKVYYLNGSVIHKTAIWVPNVIKGIKMLKSQSKYWKFGFQMIPHSNGGSLENQICPFFQQWDKIAFVLSKGIWNMDKFDCSGDLNTELIRYSNGSKPFDHRKVPYSDHHLNSELKVQCWNWNCLFYSHQPRHGGLGG